MPIWLHIATGVVAIAHLLHQSRDKVKDIPWLPIALVLGLKVVVDSLQTVSDSVRTVVAERTADYEETFEILWDSAVHTPPELGHIGHQEVQSKSKRATLVKRRRLLTD